MPRGAIRLVVRGVAAALFCLGPGSVSADPVRIPFVVTVEGTRGPVAELVGSPVAVGDRLAGLLVFDSNAARGPFSTDLLASYFDPAASIRVPGFLSSAPEIWVWNGADASEGDSVLFSAFDVRPGFRSIRTEVAFQDPYGEGGQTIHSTQLPRTPLDLLAFRDRSFMLNAYATGYIANEDDDWGSHAIHGRLELIGEDFAPVPEPATMVMVGIGLVTVAIRKRRSARTAPLGPVDEV